MIDFQKSLAAIEALDIKPVGTQKLYLGQCEGRIIAQDVVAAENSPASPTAAMDGYAVIGKEQSMPLRVTGDNAAGTDASKLRLEPGCAIKTFTGSLMPPGADTLVPIEHVTETDGTIHIDRPVPTGYAVRPVGENYRRGETLIAKGSRLGFAEIGVMASLNIAMPLVYQKPRVAILATGSEVLELGQCSDNPAQIRSSNNYTLEALVRRHGGEPIQLGAVADDRASITEAMRRGLQSADILVTTGGVSVGDYDFVKEVVREELGCEVLFKGVRLKPGQHIMVAAKEGRFVVALPGFAYSSTVTFILYVLPILYRLAGSSYRPDIVTATLKEGCRKKTAEKSEFIACNLRYESDGYVCDFAGKRQGTSAILTNLLGEAGLVWLEPGEDEKEAGQKVRVLRL